MASLCVFLAGPSTISNAFPVHYMDDALKSYSGVCDRPFSAIRAAIFASEILIAHNTREFLGEAASLYIRMTAADDLSGALFLERAAWCFAEAGLYKKASLHLTLAGYRFKKGALHQHGERCYKLAQIAYCRRGWKFAEGHIDHMLTDQKNAAALSGNDDSAATVNRTVLIDFQLLSLYVFSRSYLRHASESYTRLTDRAKFSALKAKPGYVYKTGDVDAECSRRNCLTVSLAFLLDY
uniref:Uncharacterized protein n=1 Tax=Romanomermis culicivorax TaxID=13658 RepID=A0A915JIL7_ROMCU